MNNSVSISFILLFRNLKQKSPIICFAKTISHTGGYLFYLHKTYHIKRAGRRKFLLPAPGLLFSYNVTDWFLSSGKYLH